MKKLHGFTLHKPFIALAIFGCLIVSPKNSLAQPDPNPPVSHLSVTEVLPTSGSTFSYADPDFAATVPFSGKGTIVAERHDYSAYANIHLYENHAPHGSPARWRPLLAGDVSDHKTVTPAQGATELKASGDAIVGEKSYKVTFTLSAYLTDSWDGTNPPASEDRFFSVFGRVQ